MIMAASTRRRQRAASAALRFRDYRHTRENRLRSGIFIISRAIIDIISHTAYFISTNKRRAAHEKWRLYEWSGADGCHITLSPAAARAALSSPPLPT